MGHSVPDTSAAVSVSAQVKELFTGPVFAEPPFGREMEPSASFLRAFKAKFQVDGVPLGALTVEAYDAVALMAKLAL